MRRFAPLLVVSLPLIAVAAPYNNAPMLVVQPQANPALVAQAAPAAAPAPAAPQAANTQAMPPVAYTPDFPEWAVTKVGENSAGNHNPIPGAPVNPATAPQAPAAQEAPTSAAPASPESPASPLSKLWPIDTIPIFMKSCMGFHIELAAPCKCIIVNLMTEMPHDQFIRLSADGSIEQDQRLNAIRYRCLGTPDREQE